MATNSKQNLSLGKLRRAVDGNDSYTAPMSMSKASGSAATPTPGKRLTLSTAAVSRLERASV